MFGWMCFGDNDTVLRASVEDFVESDDMDK